MTNFTAADLCLICFAIGFCFSFFSFVFGGARIGRINMPHLHGHGGGHVLAGHSGAGKGISAKGGSHVSPFNLVTLAAFLAWFGGAGYLLTRYSGWWIGFALLAAVAIGLLGAAIVFLILSKVLMADQQYMDPADYEMAGVLGRVTSPIRAHGTGEIVYTQMGTRRVCGARSEDDEMIEKGVEVMVTRYERGIAYVRPWSEVSGDEMTANGTEKDRKL